MPAKKQRKYKPTTKKQRKKNPTNVRVGYDTIRERKRKQQRDIEKMFR